MEKDLKIDEIKELLGFDFSEPTPEELEQRKQAKAKELEDKGFLPENDELSETMTSPQEIVEKNPRQFIIEECIPACLELWSKNIYTFMVSDHLNEGQCWIEVIADNLSAENKEIFMQLSGDDIIKFSYHKGTINFGVKCVGKVGQTKLLELAKQFKMQDVPQNHAYISPQQFLMDYCDCYDEIPNPEYREMKTPFEMEFSSPTEEFNYIEKYFAWQNTIASKKTLKQFNPNKATKPLEELVREHNMIAEGNRIYLSPFHYQKHQRYLNYMSLNESVDHLKR